MHVKFCPEHTMAALRSEMNCLLAAPDVKTLLVIAADGNDWDAAELDLLLKSTATPVLGAIFPQIIFQDQHYERGFICIALQLQVAYCLLSQISDAAALAENEARLHEVATEWQREEKGTLMVWVDGLSGQIGHLLDALFDCFALDKNIIGGGAGSLSLVQKPCLLTPEGLYEDAAVLINLPRRSALGVAHGWQPVSGSFKVTEAQGTVIRSLDWRPALDVYREQIANHAGITLDLDDFFSTAKSYPFGITKLSNEMVVRDPIAVDADGGLVCVGEVPEGCFVRVLHGQADQLIAAAALARTIATDQAAAIGLPDEVITVVVDCISRVLFLQERIQDELSAVSGGHKARVVGALTLGEIANSGNDYLDFYNKTCVVGLIEDTAGRG